MAIQNLYAESGSPPPTPQPSPNPSGLCMCNCGWPAPISAYSCKSDGRVKGQTIRFIRGHQKRKGLNAFEHRPDGTTVLFVTYKGEPKECLIWTRDYEKVKDYRWYASRTSRASRTLYVCAGVHQNGNLKIFRMHRLLLPDCGEIDHKNRNGLDNRVYDQETDTGNIRPATCSQNQRNQSKRAGTSSRFKGVSWSKHHNAWTGQIRINKKNVRLGSFDSEVDAARAYDAAAVKHCGEFACLNFADSRIKKTA